MPLPSASIKEPRCVAGQLLRRNAEVLVCQRRHLTSSRRAFDETFLDEEWFIDFLERAGVLADGGSNGGDADGTSFELVNDGHENLVVRAVQTILVNIQSFERKASDVHVNLSGTFHLCKVSHPSQQRIGDSRRTS